MPPAPGDAGPGVPSCFFEVTRPEAERLLERSVDGGGTWCCAPGGGGGYGRGVSVTTHQEVNGTVQVKHYKVNRVDRGYVIDVDAPHRCSSLAEAVQYFVESSKGSLQPLHRQYSPRLGERDPQSSAPHPAPHQALQLPHNHGMAEELAKKLQLRRALTGDRWVPAWRGGQPGCPPLCARNQLGQQCPPLPRAKLSLVPPGPGTRSGLGWHWGGGCAGSTAWVGAATDPQPIYLGSITPGTIPNKDTAPLIPVPAPCTMGVALGPVLSLSRPVPPQKNPFSTLGWCHPAPCAPATAVSHLHPNLFFRPEAALDVPSPVPAMRRGWHRVGGGGRVGGSTGGAVGAGAPSLWGLAQPCPSSVLGGGGLRRV